MNRFIEANRGLPDGYVCEKCETIRDVSVDSCNECNYPWGARINALRSLLGENWKDYFISDDWGYTAPNHSPGWFVQGGILNIYRDLGSPKGDEVAAIWGYERDINQDIGNRPFWLVGEEKAKRTQKERLSKNPENDRVLKKKDGVLPGFNNGNKIAMGWKHPSRESFGRNGLFLHGFKVSKIALSTTNELTETGVGIYKSSWGSAESGTS